MDNGEFKNNGHNSVTPAQVRAIHKRMIQIAKDVDLIKQSVLMLFASVTDLSEMTGAQKKKQTRKVLAAVLKLHRKSWKLQTKRLSDSP